MTPFKSTVPDSEIDKLLSDLSARLMVANPTVGDLLAEINKLDKPKRKKRNSKGV